MTMNCLAKPTQQTGEPEAPARASVPERFRRLKWNEVVWSGEAPDVFRAGSFARPIYQKEETERFRPTSTRKPKQKITAYLKPNCGWSKGVRAIFGKSQSAPTKIAISSTIRSTTLRYSKRAGRAFRLVSRSTGTCLADVNGDEVEAYLLESRRAALTSAVADAPANWACDAHHHE